MPAKRANQRRGGKQADRRKMPQNVTEKAHTSYGERTKEAAANIVTKHKR